MSDMNFLERQALERATYINRNSFNANENSVKMSNKGRNEKIRQKVTSLPVEFPEKYSYPDFKTAFHQEKDNKIRKTDANVGFSQKRNLSELLHDPEAALLTGLIMLLQSEGADEILLAALGYILL